MKKKKDWRDTLIDLIEKEILCAGRGKEHESSECYMNDILSFVEKLVKKS